MREGIEHRSWNVATVIQDVPELDAGRLTILQLKDRPGPKVGRPELQGGARDRMV